jgi:predicted adenylyl cyclase CyaB
MRNVELKVRVKNLSPLRQRLETLGARREGVLRQTDTYFHAIDGRLKLREMGEGGAELIAYDRPDERGARVSDYRLVPVERPTEMKEALERALGIRAVVAKERELWLLRQTRIHLDRVEGLGAFVELETVVGHRTLEAAGQEFEEVVAAIGLEMADSLDGSYVDLVEVARDA